MYFALPDAQGIGEFCIIKKTNETLAVTASGNLSATRKNENPRGHGCPKRVIRRSKKSETRWCGVLVTCKATKTISTPRALKGASHGWHFAHYRPRSPAIVTSRTSIGTMRSATSTSTTGRMTGATTGASSARNSHDFSPGYFSGSFCIVCRRQPPSILPIPRSDSARSPYFPSSSAFTSHASCNSNFNRSTRAIQRSRRASFSAWRL